MYVPQEFAETDRGRIEALIASNPFALLVTADDRGRPFASHLPLLFDPDASAEGTIRGHMARANPQWRHFAGGGAVLAVFSGPHAYVSPSWYGTHPSVPTWNYAAVHLYGRARVIEDPGETAAALRDLVDAVEAKFASPWSMDLPDDYRAMMLAQIVAFEIEVGVVEGKAKLSQNRGPDDRRAVADRLNAQGSDDAAGVAALMGALFGFAP